MNVEVLVSTLNKDPKKLIKSMNIQTNAIIVCQCNINGYEEISIKDKKIKVYYFNEKGVGLSRNNALMRSTGDIIIFADDDEYLIDNYEKIVINEYKKNKKAEMIMFNIISNNNQERKFKQNTKIKRIRKYNCLRYGAPRITVKSKIVKSNNIYFSLMFGPGAKYGSGEDSIFVYNLIKNKVKAFTTDKVLCEIDLSESGWFNGYNEKFFFDKGALFKAIYKRFYFIFSLYFLLKHRDMYKKIGFKKSLIMMFKGARDFKKI